MTVPDILIGNGFSGDGPPAIFARVLDDVMAAGDADVLVVMCVLSRVLVLGWCGLVSEKEWKCRSTE